jgi:hypothetical protein
MTIAEVIHIALIAVFGIAGYLVGTWLVYKIKKRNGSR